MDSSCDECGTPFNATSHRLVKESCGHEKCRQCLLAADNGCPQCTPPHYTDDVHHQQQQEDELATQVTTDLGSGELIHPSDMYWESNESADDVKGVLIQGAVDECQQNYDENDSEDNADVINSQHLPHDSKVGLIKSVIYEGECEETEVYLTPSMYRTSGIVVSTDNFGPPEDIIETLSQSPPPPPPPSLPTITTRKKTRPAKALALKHPRNVKTEEPGTSRRKINYTEDNFPAHIVNKGTAPNDGAGYYECSICNKPVNRNQIPYHIYCDPTIPRPFVCELCPKTLRTADHYRYHMTTHAPQTSFDCSDCGRTFRNKVTLAAHVRQTHSGLQPSLHCETCGKAFFSAAKYEQHRLIHTDVMPFGCLHCPRRFRLKENMLKHVTLTHTDVKAFACTFCDMRFKRSGALKIHLQRIHPGGQGAPMVAVCKVCGQGFSHFTLLKRHEKQHERNIVEYRCKLCSVVCSRKDNVIRHIRVMHYEGDAKVMPQDTEDYTVIQRPNLTGNAVWVKGDPDDELVESEVDGEEDEEGEEVVEEGNNESEVEEGPSERELQLVEEKGVTEERKSSSVIIYVGASSSGKARVQEKPQRVVTGRPVTTIRGRSEMDDFSNMSSDKMEIYRKILMPSKDVYGVEEQEVIEETEETGVVARGHQRKRVKRKSSETFVF